MRYNIEYTYDATLQWSSGVEKHISGEYNLVIGEELQDVVEYGSCHKKNIAQIHVFSLYLRCSLFFPLQKEFFIICYLATDALIFCS